MKYFINKKRKIFNILSLICLVSLSRLALAESTFDSSDFKLGVDVYASHGHLMTYKGTHDDMSATFKLKYPDFPLQPFVRASTSGYYYINESIPNNSDHTTEHRVSAGLGFDLYLLPVVRLRYISETINNKVTNAHYLQESFILIYNQFLDLKVVQVNNYLESSVIPRLSTDKLNTYFRTQFFKPYDITRTNESSNVWFPFVQLKFRDNEEQLFGASGNLGSLGLGYKHYSRIDAKSSISFLLEAHSVIYQSRELNADWNQVFAALQYSFN